MMAFLTLHCTLVMTQQSRGYETDRVKMNGLLDSLNIRLKEEPQKIAEAREKGQKVVGYFCPQVPEELILASGMLSLRLAFDGSAEAASAGESYIGPDSCPLTSSMLGYRALSGNPYFDAVAAVCIAYAGEDMPVVQTYWEKYFKVPVFPLGVPRTVDRMRTRPQATEYFRKELELLRKKLGEFSGKHIADGDIRRAIALCNRIREALRCLYEYPRSDRSPVTWRQLLEITQAGFLMERADFLGELVRIGDDLERKKSEDLPLDQRSRLMVVGGGIGIGDTKLLDAVERAGGNIVTDCLCTGSMLLRKRVPVFGLVEHPIDTLVERYLYNVPCPSMTDLPRKLAYMLKTAKEFKVHGAVFYGLVHCDATRAEYKAIKDTLYRELLIPTLLIETDYSMSDADAIKDKVAAFIDILGGRI